VYYYYVLIETLLLLTYVRYVHPFVILLSFLSRNHSRCICIHMKRGGGGGREREGGWSWHIITHTRTTEKERKKGRGGSCYWRDRKGTRHVTTRFGDDWAQHRHDDDLVVLFDSSPPSDQQHSWKSTYTRRSLWDWKILNPGAGCQSNVEFQHFFTWCYTHYNDNWQRVKSSAFIIRTYYILQPPKSCVSLTVRLESHRLDIANLSGD
jgi:hypothetical protein